MGIEILPPDINQGESGFSVQDGAIRYALTAIKSVGRPVIETIVKERQERGPYTNLNDFITRVADKDVNKRAVENFIKAGALDSLGGTRKQFMSVYVQIMDHIQKDKKNNLAGQMSLFDIVSEEEKDDFDVKLPDVGEYAKEMVLAFEKEVLGIYVSGHPLEAYEALWKKHITATTADFVLDEETNKTRVEDGAKVTVGGMISEKTIKYTKNDKVMAFITLEDLVGTVEVVIFPKDYERNSSLLQEDAKIFIQGRVSVEEDKDGKLICEKIIGFDQIPRKVWVRFANMEEYIKREQLLMNSIAESEGKDRVVVYINDTKQWKELPPNKNVCADEALLEKLGDIFGKDSVKVTV